MVLVFFLILCALIFFSHVIYFILFIIILNLIFLILVCVGYVTSTRNDKAIKIDKLKNPDIANPSFRKFYIHDKCIIWSFIRKDVIPNFENTNNLTILCNLHFTIIFNTTYSKPSISSNLRTLQIRSSHARLSGSYNTKHCQDNTICLLAKKKTYCVTSPMFTFPIA